MGGIIKWGALEMQVLPFCQASTICEISLISRVLTAQLRLSRAACGLFDVHVKEGMAIRIKGQWTTTALDILTDQIKITVLPAFL